jgi:hypothetical protein
LKRRGVEKTKGNWIGNPTTIGSPRPVYVSGIAALFQVESGRITAVTNVDAADL